MGKTHSYGSHMRLSHFLKSHYMTKRFLSAVLLTLVVFSLNATEIITKHNIDAIVAKMSLEQKARLLVGSEGKNSGISHIVPGAAGWT